VDKTRLYFNIREGSNGRYVNIWCFTIDGKYQGQVYRSLADCGHFCNGHNGNGCCECRPDRRGPVCEVCNISMRKRRLQ